ncbi:MAG: hypothetical protein JOZ22_15580, partial [Acidobacteriia bacterium]|nr:hypothetical protein [Terriglobia bacterium]
MAQNDSIYALTPDSMKAFANLSKCAVLTLVSVGLLSAAPCPTATADVYVSSFGTGKGVCTITATTPSGGTAQLTISQFTVVNVGYGLPAADLLITPLTDSNGIGLQITPTVPWTPSVTYKLDDEVQYIATVTSAAVDWPGIDRIYTELNGTATAPGFDQVVEVYCPGGFTLPPDQACPATQGQAQTLYAGPTPAGTGTTVIFTGGLYSAGPHGVCTGAFTTTRCVYSSIAVNKDMDANASLGGSAAITRVKNQFGPPIVFVPQGSCQPSSSLSALVTGKNVVSYVPKGRWGAGSTGVSAVNVEGASIVPTKIATPKVVNSCASNPVTGQTVCTANNTDVYLLTGTTLNSALTSGASGFITFSGGSCTNCGVAMDAVHNKALISLSIGGKGGFQLLDLAGPTFEPAFASKAAGGTFTN